MASDIDLEAKFNTASYKNNQKRDLEKSKRGKSFFIFLTYFQKERGLFSFLKSPP